MQRGDLFTYQGEIVEFIKPNGCDPAESVVRPRYGRRRFLQSVRNVNLVPYVRGSKKAAQRVHADHCQICGRAIGSKAGVIAHHGYTRPGDGWQTKSCFGARFRPYEVASDALPEYIQILDRAIFAQREHVAALHAGVIVAARPQRKETVYKTGEIHALVCINSHQRYGARQYVRMSGDNGYAKPGEADYNACRAIGIKRAEGTIKAITEERAHAVQRLADWKAPTGAAA